MDSRGPGCADMFGKWDAREELARANIESMIFATRSARIDGSP